MLYTDHMRKAIRKVRAVQRMRRNRGFAFSQTEERQEQLIRKCKCLDVDMSCLRNLKVTPHRRYNKIQVGRLEHLRRRCIVH